MLNCFFPRRNFIALLCRYLSLRAEKVKLQRKSIQFLGGITQLNLDLRGYKFNSVEIIYWHYWYLDDLQADVSLNLSIGAFVPKHIKAGIHNNNAGTYFNNIKYRYFKNIMY